MILAIDIGNTNIVIGCFNENKIEFTERLSTNHKSTELEYAILFKNVLEIHKIALDSIHGGIISSVVPSLTNVIKKAMQKLTNAEVMSVGPGIKTGLNILTDNPAQLGSDLVVDAVAGIHEYPTPLAIFDMGTATTISVIDKNKNYIGSVIIPGIEVSLNSLVGGTSQLPKISLEAPKNVIGKNTVDCMKSGILYSTAASIDGMIKKLEDEVGEKLTVVATGGLASTVVPLCEREIILDDELLLKGLMIIYNKNK
jgi:type III pantothenate kinase